MKTYFYMLLTMRVIVATVTVSIQHKQIGLMQAEINVLSTKFETKVEQLDYLSGRKPRVETLKEELQRIAKESN